MSRNKDCLQELRRQNYIEERRKVLEEREKKLRVSRKALVSLLLNDYIRQLPDDLELTDWDYMAAEQYIEENFADLAQPHVPTSKEHAIRIMIAGTGGKLPDNTYVTELMVAGADFFADLYVVTQIRNELFPRKLSTGHGFLCVDINMD